MTSKEKEEYNCQFDTWSRWVDNPVYCTHCKGWDHVEANCELLKQEQMSKGASSSGKEAMHISDSDYEEDFYDQGGY